MAFRRSSSKTDQSSIRRKAIVMTGAVVMLFVLVKFGVDYANRPAPMRVISLQMKNNSIFIIDTDTTNFENFASILKNKVIEARKKHAYNNIKIVVYVPRVNEAGEIASVIKIVDAMDVQFSIKTKN
jgi:hypothetical protein